MIFTGILMTQRNQFLYWQRMEKYTLNVYNYTKKQIITELLHKYTINYDTFTQKKTRAQTLELFVLVFQ